MNDSQKTREELVTELHELRRENNALKRSCKDYPAGNPIHFEDADNGKIDFWEIGQHFEYLFNTSPDAVLVTRLDDGFAVEVNDAFSKLTGYSREESLGTSNMVARLWKNPEDRNLLVSELVTNGFCKNLEGHFLRKDECTLIGLISAKIIVLKGIPHIFSIVRDITERKLVEEALRQSEQKFHSLYENMIDGSALHTLVYNDQGIPEDYRIIEVNPAYEVLLGISRESVLHKTSKEAYAVDEPPYFEMYSRVALTGKPAVFETYYAPLDKYFSISVYCPYQGSFVTIFENISDRKKVEQDLHIVLSKYQILFEIFPVGITISDKAGKVVESNPIAETLLGISQEEHKKRKIDGQEWRIIRPDGTEMEASEFASVRALEEGQPVNNVEMGIVKENNLVTWLNVSATPIPIEGYGVAIIYGDISARKKSDEALKKSEEKLRELNATKDKFFSILAHDLKSPFNAILGFSELLKDEVRNLENDSALSYTNVIHSTTRQTLKLLENLLDWVGMQRDGLHFEPKRAKLNKLIEDEIEAQEFVAKQKNLTLLFITRDEILITVDEKMLSSALRNLISNAIKFTPRNGRIIIEAKRTRDHFEVSISDNGVGIQIENIGRLFKTESSFTLPGTESERGTGLGLLLCKEFVEKHGGTIWVDSEKGKGSRFAFSIPQGD